MFISILISDSNIISMLHIKTLKHSRLKYPAAMGQNQAIGPYTLTSEFMSSITLFR